VSRACTLKQLSDRDTVVARLGASGLGPGASGELASLFTRSAGSLLEGGCDGSSGVHALFVPGRIEVLGKHTDCGGGRSMVAAAELGFCLVVVPRDDSHINMMDAALGERISFKLSSELEPDVGHWSNYPMTVARRIARNFPGRLYGADIAFASNLPMAAGMSSSSAMIVAAFLALSRINDLSSRKEYKENITSAEDLAGYLGRVENGQSYGTLIGDRGVGTTGGSQDHTAILCAQPGAVVQYAYGPVRLERAIQWPADYLFAVAVSGVVAPKTGKAMERYNRASRLVHIIIELWQRATGRRDPHVAAALDSASDATGQMRRILRVAEHPEATPDELLDRFEHFLAVSEEIVPAAGAALAGAEMTAFGGLVDRSQTLGEKLLGNVVPETAMLARSAHELGAVAASSFGAGFGGSVWAMVEREAAEQFLESWAEQYRRAFPEQADDSSFFPTPPGPAAFELY